MAALQSDKMEIRDSPRVKSARKSPSIRNGKQPSTLASRIASSATELTQDLLGRSGAIDYTGSVSSASGISAKLSFSPSGANTPTWLEDLPVRTERLRTYGSPDSSSSSFRSSPTGEFRNNEFEQFSTGQSIIPSSKDVASAHETFTNDIKEMVRRTRDHFRPSYKLDHTSVDLRSLLGFQWDRDAKLEDSAITDGTERNTSSITTNDSASRQQHDGPINWQDELYWLSTWESSFDCAGALRDDMDTFWSARDQDTEQLTGIKQNKLNDFLAGTGHVDSQTLSRLKMILGHVTDTTHSTCSGRLNQPILQTPSNAVDHEHAIISGLSSQFALLDNIPHVSVPMSQQGFYHEPSITESKHHFGQVRTGSGGAEQDFNEELLTPTFQCSWAQCQRCFDDTVKLGKCSEYSCPHVHCTAKFQDHGDWAVHIAKPHHDLLERRSRTAISGGVFGRSHAA